MSDVEENRVIFVPVRSGSKGLPGKNVRQFLGVPLLSYVIQKLGETELFTEIVVSSDSESYLNIAEEAGATLLIRRPGALSTDTCSSVEVLKHAIKEFEDCRYQTERYFLTQVTSPLWAVEDCRGFVELSGEAGDKSVVTVCESKHHPKYNLLHQTSDGSTNEFSLLEDSSFSRRQDHSVIYFINGCFYSFPRDLCLEDNRLRSDPCKIYAMSHLRSIDIDSLEDFELCELLATAMQSDEPLNQSQSQ